MGQLFGGGGGQQSTNEFKPPDYTTQGWQDWLAKAGDQASQPYSQYQGMQVAPINGQQMQGLNFIQDRALFGSPDLNAARGMATDVSSGAYLGANPYTGDGSGIGAVAGGQFLGANPYLTNEYTNKAIQQNTDAMSRGFATGTAAQNDSAFERGGAFGGSAWQQKQAQDAAGLSSQIGQMANNLQMQQSQLGTQDWNANIGQMLQAGGMGSQDFNNQMQNMLAGGNLANQTSKDDWTSGQALSGIGDFYQQNMQNQLNNNYNQWQQQNNYPLQMLDLFGNALSRASGGYGQNSAQSQQSLSTNPLTAALGIGSLIYGNR